MIVVSGNAIERLQKLHEILDDVSPGHFDMYSWCGTAACAGGHAASHPWFNKRGLTMKRPRHDLSINRMASWPTFVIDGEELQTYDALQRFFDIDVRTTHALFDPGGYPGVTHGREAIREVQRRIRNYLEFGEA